MSRLQKLTSGLFIIFVVFSLISCSSEVKRDSKLKIAVSVPTYVDIVHQIGKDKVDVFSLLPPGVNPHDIDITPAQLQKLTSSDLYIRVGNFFNMEEIVLKKIEGLGDSLKIFDSSNGVEVKYNNPHVWNGIKEVRRISGNIVAELSKIDPANKDFYEENFRSYASKIDSASAMIREKLTGLRTNVIITYHPALLYFADSFGLVEISIEKHGHEPNAKDIADLINKAKRFMAKAVYIQPQFENNTAKVVADELKADLVVIDPLPGNFLQNAWDIADKIAKYNK